MSTTKEEIKLEETKQEEKEEKEEMKSEEDVCKRFSVEVLC